LRDLREISALAAGDLRSLDGARLFITGGTGYIGRWLLEALCHAARTDGLDIRITVLSRDPARFAARYPHLATDGAVTLAEGDVRDFTLTDAAFSHVIHAATDVIASTTPLATLEVTALGTRRVLDAAVAAGARHVLLLSSGAVYGRLAPGETRFSETHPLMADVTSPAAAYGLGKTVSEWLCNDYAREHGLHCTSARIFAQTGPHLELGAHFAAGNFIRDALKGTALTIKGDGTPLRSYMYAVDLAVWLLAILVRGRSGAAYNTGSDQAVSIRELAGTVLRAAGVPDLPVEVLGKVVAGAAPNRYVPATDLARTELGLSLTVPLEEALRRTVDWNRPFFLQGDMT
jgi:dTDP-glucose 4,6-dehydratase